MKAFEYATPATEKEAIALLSPQRDKVLPLAGGMDLLARMKDYIATPDRLVNLKPMQGASAIEPTADGGLRIGALVTLTDLVGHAGLKKAYPALAEAAAEVGTPQIRNAGTVGGNLNQRPRCWYFRNEEFGCLKKGGSTCFAVEGENQFHAIFGDGPCHIVHPSSLAVPIIAYGGTFRVVGPTGERLVPSAEYFLMPDRNLFGENVLAPDEILTHVILPSSQGVKSAAYEVRFKQSHDWPLALAAVAFTMSGTTVKSAKVIMGAVAPVPWRAAQAEQALVGKTLDENLAARAAELATAGARPMRDNAYKITIAQTAVRRAILKAAGIPFVDRRA